MKGALDTGFIDIEEIIRKPFEIDACVRALIKIAIYLAVLFYNKNRWFKFKSHATGIIQVIKMT